MTDLTNALIAALSSLPACAAAAFDQAEKTLPIITAADESVSVFARADGEDYLEEHVSVVDVYAADREEAQRLSAQADAQLSALGLRRTASSLRFDEAAFAFHATLRYRCLTQQDTIYQ